MKRTMEPLFTILHFIDVSYLYTFVSSLLFPPCWNIYKPMFVEMIDECISSKDSKIIIKIIKNQIFQKMDKFSSTLSYTFIRESTYKIKNFRGRMVVIKNSKKGETIDGFQDFHSYVILLDNLNSRRNEDRYNPI